MRYLDPKNDLTFKKVFGQHPHLLKSFLNAMLPLEEDQVIESLEYLPTELVPDIPLMKHTIVDVRCKDKKGRQFIVEMQMCWTDDFKQRVLFNASKAYIKQLDKGKNYSILQPVYALSLVNEIFEPKLENFYHHYRIVHTEQTDKVIKGLEFVFVELPKFKPQNINEKRLQVLWLRYLTEIKDGTSEISNDLFDNPETKEAVDYLQESAFSKEELEYYDKYWDSIQSEKTLYEGAEKKGKIEVAKNLKNLGVDIATIQKSTGLSKEEIEKL
ncbi:MAG: Rpn family recombination-promoting nuclease/putative transposase [Bacteroidales bacterium]|jgi:predicted transposase/invertase (TIGR01784 family)